MIGVFILISKPKRCVSGLGSISEESQLQINTRARIYGLIKFYLRWLTSKRTLFFFVTENKNIIEDRHEEDDGDNRVPDKNSSTTGDSTKNPKQPGMLVIFLNRIVESQWFKVAFIDIQHVISAKIIEIPVITLSHSK